MGKIRIILLAFVIAALMSIFASQGAFVYADQLVGVTKATNLIGKRVTNLEGKNLGEIKDLVIDWRSGGYIEYAVLSFGGFLGLGDKYFAIPWEVMVLSHDKEQFILNVKEERLRSAPGFDKDNWPDMSHPEWAMEVYQFYDLLPNASKEASRSSSAEVSQMMTGEAGVDFKNTVREALNHAMEAESAGKEGKPETLVTHAKKSLDSAKYAQRSGYNERLNEGVYALGEAIEHGEKQQTADATEHMIHAIMNLSRSAGLQIPEDVATGRSAVN
ncbi:MAG TPA: small metal-binding protein SmbP [Nitrospira sp.]|nr:small metal-binding protein SmbP [Nitrospira sp.]